MWEEEEEEEEEEDEEEEEEGEKGLMRWMKSQVVPVYRREGK